jgi:hypothetical protein
MSRARFAVTFEIITAKSAEHGDAEERGHVEESATLRDALKAARGAGVESIETDSSHGPARWITITAGQDFETGAYESRALHIPEHVTNASRARIVRLVRCERVLGRGRHVRAVWYGGDMEAFADSYATSAEGIQVHCRAPDAWGVYDREPSGRLSHIVDHATRKEAEADLAP